MNDNKKKDKVNKLMHVVLGTIFIAVVVPLLLIFMFWVMNISLLDKGASIIETVHKWMKEIAVITACVYGLIFYYAGQFFFTKKPKKSTDLASMSWMSLDELKKDFKTVPIDAYEEIKVGGIPIYKIDDKYLLYDPEVNQVLVIGATRSGKTRKLLIILIFLCAKAGESIFCNDPKKELYKMCRKYLIRMGYKVFCLDYRDLETSDCKNPMDRVVNFLKEKDTDEADQAAQDLVETLVIDNGAGEKIWIDGQKAMAKATILAVSQANVSENKKNFYAVYQTLNIRGGEHSFNGDPKNKKMELTAYMEYLEETNIARTAYAPIRNAPEKTRGSFMTSTMSTLQLFGSRKLNKAIGKSDFQFKDLATEKIAVFVVNPDEKSTYDRIASIIYDQSYQEFVETANKNGGTLKTRINNIFDEAGNMAVIKDLDKKLTVSLGRGILYFLFIQSYAQLDKLYKNEGRKIICDNCVTKFFISSADYDTCEDVSKDIGEETIWVNSATGNFSQQANPTGGSTQYSQQRRRLMDANELKTADFRDGNGIILTKTYKKPAQVVLPDCSAYDEFYKELDDPKKAEIPIKEDRELLYAVPRWIVITKQELSIPFNTLLANVQRNDVNNSPRVEEMYWYWSMRNDLDEVVKKHVLKKVADSNFSMKRAAIKKYLNSKEFLSFIDPLDIVDKETRTKNTKKNFEESTVLQELVED